MSNNIKENFSQGGKGGRKQKESRGFQPFKERRLYNPISNSLQIIKRQEIKMDQNKQGMDISPETTDAKQKRGLGHWLRVAVMFLSGGFIFPHAMEEDEENST
jgi:hypothetical protein